MDVVETFIFAGRICDGANVLRRRHCGPFSIGEFTAAVLPGDGGGIVISVKGNKGE